jgi:hypothetical protein
MVRRARRAEDMGVDTSPRKGGGAPRKDKVTTSDERGAKI